MPALKRQRDGGRGGAKTRGAPSSRGKPGSGGRGRGAKAGGSAAPRRGREGDEEIGLTLDSPERSDDDSIDSRLGDEGELSSDADDARETPAQKRLRLAKVYVEDLQSRKSKRGAYSFVVDRSDSAIVSARDRAAAPLSSGADRVQTKTASTLRIWTATSSPIGCGRTWCVSQRTEPI